jgi:hypothetical protein
MGLFTRTKTPEVQASTASSTAAVSSAGAAALLSSVVGTGRGRAMALPTISRGRDLLASLIGSLPLRQYGTAWNGEDLEEVPLPPEPWMLRPDPRTTRAHILSWTFDDLLFTGRAYWLVTRRYAPNGDRPVGFPAGFEWMPSSMVQMTAPMFAGNVPVGAYSLTYNGVPIRNEDVIVFYSPLAPLLEIGARAIITTERLDNAAMRFASTPAAFGWLKVTGGEPLDGDELADLAEGWATARDDNAVAALSEYVDWHESTMDPSRLQLLEARQHQALELARLVNVHPSLVGAPAGSSMTYQNVEQARAQLLQDALPFVETIEQTLSSDTVTPRGRLVRLDRSAWHIAEPQPTPADPAAQEATV